MFINTLNPVLTHVTNAAGATIEGSADSFAAISPVSLINNGLLIGEVAVTDIASLVNHGKIRGDVVLEGSHDLFNGAGGTSGAILAMGAGSDRIIGGNGNVQIHIQGTGNDTLTAGPGHDQFFFEFMPTGPVETITNFKPALDKIVLSASDFTGIGTIGHQLDAADFHVGAPGTTTTTSQHIIYNPTNGRLYYDQDGSGSTYAPIQIAELNGHPALTHSAFLVEA